MSWEDVPAFRPLDVHAAMRPSCPQCDYSPLVWMFAANLPTQVIPKLRGDAVRALAQVRSDSDAWLCLRCDRFGIMLD